jgi:hypothetical protein
MAIDKTSTVVGLGLLVATLGLVQRLRKAGDGKPPLPPSPPGDPLIRHIRLLGEEDQVGMFMRLFKALGKKTPRHCFVISIDLVLSVPTGDIVSLKVPGGNVIVLNSIKAATDLLEKRSAIYSDRPQSVVYDM